MSLFYLELIELIITKVDIGYRMHFRCKGSWNPRNSEIGQKVYFFLMFHI